MQYIETYKKKLALRNNGNYTLGLSMYATFVACTGKIGTIKISMGMTRIMGTLITMKIFGTKWTLELQGCQKEVG